jgi:hypothetical protein
MKASLEVSSSSTGQSAAANTSSSRQSQSQSNNGQAQSIGGGSSVSGSNPQQQQATYRKNAIAFRLLSTPTSTTIGVEPKHKNDWITLLTMMFSVQGQASKR